MGPVASFLLEHSLTAEAKPNLWAEAADSRTGWLGLPGQKGHTVTLICNKN